MKNNTIFTRVACIILAVVLLLSEGNVFLACATTEESHETCSDCESSERIELSGEDISNILSGDSETNITFAPEVESALIQAMEEISRLIDAGQIEYDEDTNTYVVIDPYADLSGLNITGIDTVDNADGSQRFIANVGVPTNETVAGFVLLSETSSSNEEHLIDETPTEEEPIEEEPTEEEPTEENPTEEEPTEEEPAEDEPTEEEPTEEEPTEEEPTEEEPTEEEPTEEEPTEEEPTEEEPTEEDPAEEESTEEEPIEEDPTEEEPTEDEPTEEEPTEEEPIEEEPTEENPTEEESTEEEPTEEEPTEEEPTEEELTEEETDQALNEDVELLWWSSCDHKATKSANVPYYNTYKDGRKKQGTISKKGTIVEVVDSKRNGFFGSLYYKVKIKGKSGTYWVHSDNLKNHECTANSVTKTTEYTQISNNNDKHWKTVTTPAKSCTKCGCSIASKDVDKSKQDHDWNGLGVCKLCGYNFKESKDNCTDAVYLVIKDNVTLRKDPYSASTATRTLNNGDSVVVTHTVKNAFHTWLSPHIWYLTDQGDWIYSENAEKHKHTYNDESTKTGKCTVCKRMYKYDIVSVTDTPYEVAVSYSAPIRKYPYSKSDIVAYTAASTAYTVNAYTNSDPNRTYWNCWGERDDKWYRIEGVGWIKHSDIKEHVKHKYTQASGATCCYSGCSETYTLKTTKVDSLAYETKTANVVARNQPYSIGTVKKTYTDTCTIVQIDRKATNSLKEEWLRTTEGNWIKASELKLHAHNLKVGVCTANGCSYISNVQTVSCKKYTGELTGSAAVKEKPFADAKTIKTLPANSCMTINGSCTVEGTKWYRTTDGHFINASFLKKHSHNYQSGYCAPCGSYQTWTTTVINPIVVKAKADNTVVREKPYAVAPVTRTLSKDDEIVIVQKCTNALKRTWYQLVDGTWIYSGNVKTSDGAKVTTSNKLAVDGYTITLIDDCGDPIVGASVEWYDQTYTSNEDGKVSLAYVTTKTDMIITMTGYDKITLTDHVMSTSRKETITMALTGSYKATEVIMNYLGSDINVLRTSKNLNKYHTQLFFQKDFTITCKVGDSVADKVGKYELVQGTDVVATTKDGTFTGLDVGDFASHKTVYLKVYDTKNKERAKQALRINIFDEGLDGSTPNLDIGFGTLKITIPVGCPLIGGFEIKFDPPSIVDYSIDINDDSTTYSLEVDLDLWAKKVSKSSSPNKKDTSTNTTDEVYWSDFTAYKDFWNKFKTAKEQGWKTYNNAKLAEEAKDLKKNGGKTKLDWDFAIGGYIEKMHGEDIWNGMIYFNVKVGKDLPDYPLPPPATPLTLGVSFTLEGTIGAKMTLISGQVTDFSIPLDVTGTVEVSLNIGLKNVISASIFGQASLGIEFQLYPIDLEELNIFLRASLGVKAKALGAEVFRFTLLESPIIYIVQEGKLVFLEYDDPYAALMDVSNYTPIDRSYLYDRSGWYDAGAELLEDVNVSISDMDVEVLQSNTYTDLKPQVVTSDDGTIMMLFTDDNAERADIDRTMLVFSLYDPATKAWTEPEAVYDDGTGDYGFSAHSVGEDIYLVWQNATSTHAADADITAVSRSLEITIAKYDAVAKEFVCIEQLTENDVYESMPRISAVNGQVVVSWLTNSEHDIFQRTGENTVWYAVKTEEDYDTREAYSDEIDYSVITDTDLDVPVEEDSDETYEDPAPTPWTVSAMDPIEDTITSLAVGYMLDQGYVAYTTDADGDTSTAEDQLILLIDATTGELMSYTDQACNVEFTRVHGDNAMTWYNQGAIYYALDPDYAPMILFTDETLSEEASEILYEDVNLGNNYQIISDDQGNMAILSTRNGESCSNAFVMLYDDANYQWGLPVAITDQDQYISDFYGAYHEGTIISIFNRTSIDDTTYTETNTLCSAVINQRNDLSISGASANTYNLQPYSETPVWMTVTNNGTSRVEGFTAILYDSNGNELCRQVVDEPLRMGESTPVEFTLTMGETVEQTTYRLEVSPNDVEDDHPENNEYYFDVGAPHLVLNAENQSTDTEDIVVLTVTNMGYGELGGSLVLLNDDDTISDVLVEEFAPVDHEGEYTCAILFSEEYFDGQSSAIFRFGIIPTGTSQTTCETSIYVDKVLPADSATITIEDNSLEYSDEDAVLMEVTEKTVTGTVTNDTELDLTNVTLCASAYDVNGVWLDSHVETITLPSEESYSFTAVFLTETDIESVSITLLDSDTMEPLITAEQITLTYDIISY